MARAMNGKGKLARDQRRVGMDIAGYKKMRQTSPAHDFQTWPPGFDERSKALFEMTGNALHVWKVIGFAFGAHGRKNRHPLPDWCVDYLAEIASRFHDLSNGQDFRLHELDLTPVINAPITPVQANALVTAALGLSAPGWSAFKEWNSRDQQILSKVVSEHVTTRKINPRSPKEAVSAVAEVLRGKPLKAPLHESERVAINRKIRQGLGHIEAWNEPNPTGEVSASTTPKKPRKAVS